MHIERLPSFRPPAPPRVTGNAQGASSLHPFEVTGARRLSLEVVFAEGASPLDGEVLSEVRVYVHGRLDILTIGRCRFQALAISGDGSRSSSMPPSSSAPRSSSMPPSSSGAYSGVRASLGGRRGHLAPLDAPLDCRELFRSGRCLLIADVFEQLPLLFARKEQISEEFRRFTADLVYDLRVYRSIFDDIDVGLACESEAVRSELEACIIAGPGRRFMAFIEEKMAALEDVVRSFSRQDHERHGFYFRRQIWDLILTSPFLARTNLRPLGYAGDWVMMQYAYQNEYVGSSLFGKLLHKSSMETQAAQAVRARRRLIAVALDAARRAREAGSDPGPLRFLSVACGPACEVEDVFATAADAAAYDCALLDQDEEALREAARAVRGVEQRIGSPVRARFIRQSVRTMLRKHQFAEMFGRHHVVYSMGLFDYLTAPVAKAVLKKLYELIEPGGQLVVGNYHVSNPTRWYMEYWMDWTLIHRSEEDLLALAKDLPGATSSVTFEVTGSQMFLWVRKAER